MAQKFIKLFYGAKFKIRSHRELLAIKSNLFTGSAFILFTFIVSSLGTMGIAGCARSQNGAIKSASDAPFVVELSTNKISKPSSAYKRLAQLKQKRRKQEKALYGTAGLDDSTILPASLAAISSEVTLSKKEIFDQDFLYGSDLQFSSISSGPDMLLQALAIGHAITRFRIYGDHLQLIEDQSYLFESNINHPKRLIFDFPIIRQDDDTITVSIYQGSPSLANLLGPASPIANNWVRSVQFVQDGQYLLIETTIELEDGSIAEIMESVFPRNTLLSKTDVKPVFDDPALNPYADRFLYISQGSVFLDLEKGRTKTALANRFQVDEGKSIDWYVTPNLPKEYLPVLKSAVEGWNRYSQKMWNRDFILFKGYLPSTAKVGDPRFNVIVWDSVPDASSAYESQASDPLTGIQSHSLIYLPYAWVKIGKEFWQMSENTKKEDEPNIALTSLVNKGNFLGKKLAVTCLEDVSEGVSLEARKNQDVFAKELLKGVLFHEIGHALGLGHNFKGSLSYDPLNADSIFSNSIMDYNQYQLEDMAFDSVDASTGPLLEYDRQIISVLYNDGKDIGEADPVVPACSDEEADDQMGGVDPLCMRYDAGKDPTSYLEYVLNLVRNATSEGPVKTMSESVSTSVESLGDPKLMTDEEKVTERLNEFKKELVGIGKYYIGSGAQSINYMVRANIKSLYAYNGDLPQGYSETEMRKRAIDSLMYVTNGTDLNKTVDLIYSQSLNQAQEWVESTAWFNELTVEEQQESLQELKVDLASTLSYLQTFVIPSTRSRLISSLTFVPTLPFYFSIDGNSTTDFESTVIELLENAVSQNIDGHKRTLLERSSAARTLATYAGLKEGKEAIDRVRSKITSELRSARNTADREGVRGLLKSMEM